MYNLLKPLRTNKPTASKCKQAPTCNPASPTLTYANIRTRLITPKKDSNMQKPWRFLSRLCAYTHLWRILKDRKLPASAMPGLSVALLGLLCPFFWIALFTGASREELMFHGCHSGLVFAIGILLMLQGLSRERK